MPEELDETIQTEEIEEEAASGKSSLLIKANIALVLLAVVFAECMAAYFFVPDPAETAALVGATIPKEPEEDDDPFGKVEAAMQERVEVDLGEFHFTAHQPLSNSAMRFDFHLYGTVIKDDEEAFLEVFEESKNRFRDQTIVIFRSAELSDFTDPKLGLIKRKILETSKKIFGESFLRTIIFSDFSSVEQ